MKILYVIAAATCLLSCTKEDGQKATKLYRKEEVANDTLVLATGYEYDAQGRILSISKGRNAAPLQTVFTVTYGTSEVLLNFTPVVNGSGTTSTQIRLLLDAQGRMVKRLFSSQTIDASQPLNYLGVKDTIDCTYDATGALQTVFGRRLDSAWSAAGIIHTIRRSFTSQYTTTDGKLTRVDQYGTTIYKRQEAGNLLVDTGSLEYHTQFSYTKLHPNAYDVTNAVVLNQYVGDVGPDRNYAEDFFEPLISPAYRYLPDRTQLQALEKDGKGNVTIGFNADVSLDRTYNRDGLLETVTVLTPGSALKTIRYFYRK